MGPKKFCFKANVNYDISLLSEVEAQNPYAFKNQKPVWEDIAIKLQKSELKMAVTERSCRDRTTLLLEQFSKSEDISQKLSGADEDGLNAVTGLLTSIMKLKNDKKVLTMKTLYNKSDREAAEERRNEVLAEIEAEVDNDMEEIPSSKEVQSAKDVKEANLTKNNSNDHEEPSKKRVKKCDMISYLKEKHTSEMDFKREELSLRAKEAENKRLALELDSKKFEQDCETKKMELQLSKQKQDYEIQEKSLLTQALMKFLKQ